MQLFACLVIIMSLEHNLKEHLGILVAIVVQLVIGQPGAMYLIATDAGVIGHQSPHLVIIIVILVHHIYL
jgi:hypothetical protein